MGVTAKVYETIIAKLLRSKTDCSMSKVDSGKILVNRV